MVIGGLALGLWVGLSAAPQEVPIDGPWEFATGAVGERLGATVDQMPPGRQPVSLRTECSRRTPPCGTPPRSSSRPTAPSKSMPTTAPRCSSQREVADGAGAPAPLVTLLAGIRRRRSDQEDRGASRPPSRPGCRHLRSQSCVRAPGAPGWQSPAPHLDHRGCRRCARTDRGGPLGTAAERIVVRHHVLEVSATVTSLTFEAVDVEGASVDRVVLNQRPAPSTAAPKN